MAKRSKAYLNAKEKIGSEARSLEEAIGLLKEIKSSNFDEYIPQNQLI